MSTRPRAEEGQPAPRLRDLRRTSSATFLTESATSVLKSVRDSMPGYTDGPLRGTALLVLPPDSQARERLRKFIFHPGVDIFINCIIIINVVLLVFKIDSNSYAVDTFSVAALGLFTLELLLKSAALGAINLMQNSALDAFDMVVVTLSLVALAIGVESLATLRLLRILRPLRALRLFASLDALLASLTRSLRFLLRLIYVLLFFYVLFGVLAVSNFGGSLRRACASPDGVFDAASRRCDNCTLYEPRTYCNFDDLPKGGFMCSNLGDYICIDAYNDGMTHFDNILSATLSNFVISTFEGWSDLQYAIQDADFPLTWVYFVTVLVVCGYLLTSLCVSIIVSVFTEVWDEEQERALQVARRMSMDFKNIIGKASRFSLHRLRFNRRRVLPGPPVVGHVDVADDDADSVLSHDSIAPRESDSKAHRRALMAYRLAIMATRSHDTSAGALRNQAYVRPAAVHPLDEDAGDSSAADARLPTATESSCRQFRDRSRLALQKLFKTKLFKATIMVVIMVNVVLASIVNEQRPQPWVDAAELIFLAIFSAEVLLKMYAFGPRAFWSRRLLNKLDILLVVLAALAELVGTASATISSLRFLRFIRVIKLSRLLFRLHRTRRLLRLVAASGESWVTLGSLFFIVLSCLALLCTMLWSGKLPAGTRNGFDSFLRSGLTLFQLSTGEDWLDIYSNCLQASSNSWACPAVLFSWFLFSSYVMLNLFTAVVVSNFELEEEEKARYQEETFLELKRQLGDDFEDLPAPPRRRRRHRMPTDDGGVAEVIKTRQSRWTHAAAMALAERISSGSRITNGLADLVTAARLARRRSSDASHASHASHASITPTTPGAAPAPPRSAWTVAVGKASAHHDSKDGEEEKASSHADEDAGEEKATDTTDDASEAGSSGAAAPAERVVIVARETITVLDEGSERPAAAEDAATHAPQGLRNLWAGDKSLGCIPPTNRLRATLKLVCDEDSESWQHRIFHGCVLASIVASCVLLALEHPRQTESERDSLRRYTIGFVVVFCIEVVVKVIAHGLAFTPQAYLKSQLNWLDLLVIVAEVLNLALGVRYAAVLPTSLRTLRLLRCLRPLRLLSALPSMRVFLDSLISARSVVVTTLLLVMAVYVFFALLGKSVFSHRFWSCNDPSVGSRSQCVGFFVVDGLNSSRQWVNPEANFDTFTTSLRTIFEVSTLEGWVDVMHNCMDITDFNKQPVQDASWYNALFFVIFIVVLTFVMLEILVGVAVNNISLRREYTMLTSHQRERQYVEKMMSTVQPIVEKRPQHWLRAACYDICVPCLHSAQKCRQRRWHALHSNFDAFMMVLILLNTVVLMMQHNPMPADLEAFIDVANAVFLAAFTVEIVVKLAALGPRGYLEDKLNVFDLFLVCGALLLAVLDLPLGAQVARAFRTGRLIRLVQTSKDLRILFNTLAVSAGDIATVFFLMILLLFGFSVAGMELYGDLGLDGDYSTYTGLTRHAHFHDLFSSMNLMFRMSTGENWQLIMHDAQTKSKLAPIFFVSFMVLVAFILLNFFQGLILDNFEYSFSMEKARLGVVDLQQFRRQWRLQELRDGSPSGFIARHGLEYFLSCVTRPHRPRMCGKLRAPTSFQQFLYEAIRNRTWMGMLRTELSLDAECPKGYYSFHATLRALVLLRFGSNALLPADRLERERKLAAYELFLQATRIQAIARGWLVRKRLHAGEVELPTDKPLEDVQQLVMGVRSSLMLLRQDNPHAHRELFRQARRLYMMQLATRPGGRARMERHASISKH